MNKNVIQVGLLLCVAAFSVSVHGWGRLGHQVVCDIAWRESSQTVRKNLADAARRMGFKTFAQACVWPDLIKRRTVYDYLKPLHYINVKKSEHRVNQSACLQKGKRNGSPLCVVPAIPFYWARYHDEMLTQRQRDEALLLFGHFVADVHQPLHVSYRADLGGNRKIVVIDGKRTNLHALWDNRILQCGDRKWWHSLVADVYRSADENSNAVDRPKKAPLVSERLKDSMQRDVIVWANESLRITKQLYKDTSIIESQTYCQRYYPIAQQRLSEAGLRLSQWLRN